MCRRLKNLDLKFTLSAYLWEMKILNKALPPFLAAKNIFRKKKQRYIHKGDNDDADNNDNNERPHLFIFQFID